MCALSLLLPSRPAAAQGYAQFSGSRAEWRPGPMSSAVPVWYGFRHLLPDLWWSEIQVPPQALVDAHARYAEAMQRAMVESVPFVLMMGRNSDAGRALNVSPEDRERYTAHQRRMIAAAEAGEARLFDELASALASDEAAVQRLAQLRERRRLEATIARIRSAAGVGEDCLTLPRDTSTTLRRVLEAFDLSPEERRAVVSVEQKHAQKRAAAWTGSESAVQTAVDAVFELQAYWVRSRLSGPMGQRAYPVAPEARAAVIAAEWSFAREVMQSLPADVHEEAASVVDASLWTGTVAYLRFPLPDVDGRQPRSIRALAVIVLGRSDLSDEKRKAARSVLEAWCREEMMLYAAGVDRAIERLRQEAPPSYDPVRLLEQRFDEDALDDLRQPLAELATRMRAQLSDATGMDFRANSVTLPLQESPAMLGPEDRRLIGRQRESLAPVRSERRFSETFAGKGRIPHFPSDEWRVATGQQGGPDEAARLVVDAVVQDGRDAWATRVEPLTQRGDRDDAAWLAAGRSAWDEADAVVQAMATALDAAAPERVSGVTLGQRLWVQWLSAQEQSLLGSGVGRSMWQSRVPVMLESVLVSRGSPTECQDLITALVAHSKDIAADLLALRAVAWEVHERGDALRHVQESGRQGSRGASDEAERAKLLEANDAYQASVARAREMLLQKRADWASRIASHVPPEVAERWLRTVRLSRVSGEPALGDTWRVDLEDVLASRPEHRAWVSTVREVVSPELDARDAWACAVVTEVERRTGTSTLEGTPASRELDRELGDYPSALLERPCQDYVERAMYRLAHALPPEVAQSLPLMRLYLR